MAKPKCFETLWAAGWQFHYSTEYKMVYATHPLGGKIAIAELQRPGRDGFDMHEIGEAFAAFLNGDE